MKKLFLAICLGFFFFSCDNDTFDYSDSGTSSKTDSSSKAGTTYSFYLGRDSAQIWAELSGEEGKDVPSVESPSKANYKFIGWESDDNSSLPSTFGSTNMNFYAQWEASNGTKARIGTKDTATNLYDIIFSDGSAMEYPTNLDDLTDEQLEAAVAMIYSVSYDPSSGSNSGTSYKFKLAAGLYVGTDLKWCERYYEKDDDVDTDSEEDAHSKYYSLYTGYAPPKKAVETVSTDKAYLSLKSLNSNYGKSNYVDSSIFKAIATEKYAPAFAYCINYAVTHSITGDFSDNWYLPSVGELKVLFGNTEIRDKFVMLHSKKYGKNSSGNNVIMTNGLFWSSYFDQSVGSVKSDYRLKTAKENPYTQLRLYDPYYGITDNSYYVSLKSDNPRLNEAKDAYIYDFYYEFYNRAYTVKYDGSLSIQQKDTSSNDSGSFFVVPIWSGQ